MGGFPMKMTPTILDQVPKKPHLLLSGVVGCEGARCGPPKPLSVCLSP